MAGKDPTSEARAAGDMALRTTLKKNVFPPELPLINCNTTNEQNTRVSLCVCAYIMIFCFPSRARKRDLLGRIREGGKQVQMISRFKLLGFCIFEKRSI